MEDSDNKNKSRISRLADKAIGLWNFLNKGIWSDPRRSWQLNILRTINLSVNSFLNRDIQTQACAMTYRTMLAFVPALALLFAIGRGFGFQTVLQEELYKLLPAQKLAIKYGINFVDTYLSQASEGIFVGIGILFLLWTLISLVSNVESTFNLIWGQKNGRSMWRKITDYTAMLLILPILMICTSGLNLLLSSTLQNILNFSFMTPVISILLEIGSFLMTCLFFALVYALIPNTKVKIVNALISGAIAGIGFLILQWLFVTGTLYVTKYNAIYGSFAFLPLLMLWLQLTWVIILAGAVICYSSQNVFAFSLQQEVASMSATYRSKALIAITAIITQRFIKHQKPITTTELMDSYEFPARLVTKIIEELCAAGIASKVLISNSQELYGFQLAMAPEELTVEYLLKNVYNLGASDFIPDFNNRFPGVTKISQNIANALSTTTSKTLLSDIEIKY